MKNSLVGIVTFLIVGLLVVVFWRVILFLILGIIMLFIILGFIARRKIKGFVNASQYEEPYSDNQESIRTDVIDAEFSVKDSGESHD